MKLTIKKNNRVKTRKASSLGIYSLIKQNNREQRRASGEKGQSPDLFILLSVSTDC